MPSFLTSIASVPLTLEESGRAYFTRNQSEKKEGGERKSHLSFRCVGITTHLNRSRVERWVFLSYREQEIRSLYNPLRPSFLTRLILKRFLPRDQYQRKMSLRKCFSRARETPCESFVQPVGESSTPADEKRAPVSSPIGSKSATPENVPVQSGSQAGTPVAQSIPEVEERDSSASSSLKSSKRIVLV